MSVELLDLLQSSVCRCSEIPSAHKRSLLVRSAVRCLANAVVPTLDAEEKQCRNLLCLESSSYFQKILLQKSVLELSKYEEACLYGCTAYMLYTDHVRR